MSSAGDKLSDSSATNASLSSSNHRVNEMNGQQGYKSNGISTISKSKRKSVKCSNQTCIAPSGKFENINGNCNDEEEN